MAKINLACIFLASGKSVRFGSNKLLAPIGGIPMAQLILQNHPAELFLNTIVVTRYPFVALIASERGFTVCENEDESFDIAHTIALGVSALPNNIDGCVFSVCDQPFFKSESMKRLVDTFCEYPDNIIAAAENGVRKNPVIFPKALFAQLLALPKNTAGNAVIAQNKHLLKTVDISAKELHDIDTVDDY